MTLRAACHGVGSEGGRYWPGRILASVALYIQQPEGLDNQDVPRDATNRMAHRKAYWPAGYLSSVYFPYVEPGNIAR